MHYDHAKVTFLFWLIDYWWVWIPTVLVVAALVARWALRKIKGEQK